MRSSDHLIFIALFVMSLWNQIMSVGGFAVPLMSRGGGGREPQNPDKVDYTEAWEPTPALDDECRLIVVQVTDVYTLEYFPSLKTLLQEIRSKSQGSKVVSVLTGDFLSPYLLSSIDKGAGMMMALHNTPVDYLTWGNHEADIEHKTVCKHVRAWHKAGRKFINSNMIDHEAMDAQQEYEVIEIASPNGKHTRKIGLCAVLSNDPKLYEAFKSPGAFGGATITDPWEALDKYDKILRQEEHCDLVVPLQHLYVPDDHKTCESFDFPVILSGHDHHKVDEVVSGTRLLKPGMNGIYATVLEVSWSTKDVNKPKIRSRFVEVANYEPDPELVVKCEQAYDALAPLRNTELTHVPSEIEPLSSSDSRGSVCSMGKYICNQIRAALNVRRRQRNLHVDAVLLMGGNIRGNADYEPGTPFSLEMLESEIKSDEVIGVIPMPGWLLAKGIEETHSGDPIPGWMQYDYGIQEKVDELGHPSVTHVSGHSLDPDAVYRVGTKIADLTNGQSPSWTAFYKEHPELIPSKSAYINIHAELLANFARNTARRLWLALSHKTRSTLNPEDRSEMMVSMLDKSGDGVVTVEEIQLALGALLHMKVDERELSLAQYVHGFVDTNGDGTVTVDDFERIAQELEETAPMEPDWFAKHRGHTATTLDVQN